MIKYQFTQEHTHKCNYLYFQERYEMTNSVNLIQHRDTSHFRAQRPKFTTKLLVFHTCLQQFSIDGLIIGPSVLKRNIEL
jgi:hypothetical protein